MSREIAVDRDTVRVGVARLEAAGLLAVERRDNGQVNFYRVGDGKRPENPTASENESGRKTPPVGKPDRPENPETAGRKTPPLAAGKPGRNHTDQLNQRGKGAASPPPSPALKVPSPCAQIVGLWVSLHREATGQEFLASGRGQLAGTIRNMLKAVPATDLEGYVHRWFGYQRKDYGVALFKAKVEGGDAELIGRTVAPPAPDPIEEENWRKIKDDAAALEARGVRP